MDTQRPPTLDWKLAEVAQRQYGIVSQEDLRRLGVTREGARHRARCGRLVRVHPGTWAVGYRPTSNESRWISAVLASGPESALSHWSAARLWGVWRGKEIGTHVQTGRSHDGVAGVTTHRSRSFPASDRTTRFGIPVTTIERTLVDLARYLTAGQLANMMYEAAYRGLLNLRRLRSTIARLANGRPIRALVRALHLHAGGSSGTRSALEDELVALVQAGGLPMPAINERVRVSGRHIEVDLCWRAQKVVVECDGPAHRRHRSTMRDAARDRLLAGAGYTVVRVTRDEVVGRPASVLRRITQAVRC